MKNKNKKFFCFISAILLILFCTSCVTSTRVHIDANVSDAEVIIDGKRIGFTPVDVTISNAVWEDHDVILQKDGYKTLQTDLEKEIKIVNTICGITIWYPSLLWCFGPKPYQYYLMYPEYSNNSVIFE